MIKKYSLKALERAINYALSLDEYSGAKLLKLDHRVIEMNITPLDVKFFMHFIGGQIELMADCDLPVDTVIKSTPLGLIRLSFLPASAARSLFNGSIEISGDVEVGTALKQVFDTLDIDWEGYLARFTGDVIACQVGELYRRGRELGRDVRQSLKEQTRDFLQEESRLFPTSEEVDDFYHDIDALAIDTARLEANIQQILDANEHS